MTPQGLTSISPSSLALGASASQVAMTHQQGSALDWVFALILVTFYVAVFLFWLWLDRDVIGEVRSGVHAVKAAAVPHPAQAPAETAPADDLKQIEGIGPEIAKLLQQAEITTFGQLAETDVDCLNEILRDAGLSMANPAMWPAQARLAADGAWAKLEKFQNELKRGIRVG